MIAIGFTQLRIICAIGTDTTERSQPQDLYIDLRLELCDIPKNDDLAETIDYSAIAALCAKIAQQKNYHLLETLASDIAEEVLHVFAVSHIWLKISKPAALPLALNAFVEYQKTKEISL